MDEKPFLEINLLDLDRSPINELKKLTKSAFNIEEMLPAAWELKYVREFKRILNHQLKTPSDEFVKVLAKEAYSGVIGPKKLEQFREVTLQALKQFINDQINSRLQSALDSVDAPVEPNTPETLTDEVETADNNGIVTTEEEIEGYHIVRAILSEITNPSRITYKDTKNYLNVLLENNSWKPICRLHLNSKTLKRIGLFDGDKEEKIEISSISDIYQHSERLKAAFTKYEVKVNA